ncbi:MAG: hypothetical protein ACOX81_04015 [Candidatus Heteroscillospira sp.]|jgi:hypothetical protein
MKVRAEFLQVPGANLAKTAAAPVFVAFVWQKVVQKAAYGSFNKHFSAPRPAFVSVLQIISRFRPCSINSGYIAV